MGEAEILIAGLLVAVAGLSALARSLSVPYPIVLVLGGAVLGFVPGLPEVKLDPEVVLGRLPPAAALRRVDLHEHERPASQPAGAGAQCRSGSCS